MLLNKSACYLLGSLIGLGLLQSCVAHQELITLNAAEEQLEQGNDQLLRKQELHTLDAHIIYPNDLLIININTFEGSTTDFIQQEFASNSLNNNGNREFGPDALYYNGYLVDPEGYITLPLLEKIKVEGKSVYDLKSELDSAYANYFKFVSANVKLANMRVTVLGEVDNPGVYYFYNDQTTILEAISMAGDFSDFGNRKKVKLIRRTPTGTETAMLNLFKSDFIETDYYYIRPNDLIYIEPIKAKGFDVGAQSVGIVLSVISTAALLANILLDIGNNN